MDRIATLALAYPPVAQFLAKSEHKTLKANPFGIMVRMRRRGKGRGTTVTQVTPPPKKISQPAEYEAAEFSSPPEMICESCGAPFWSNPNMAHYMTSMMRMVS